MEAQNLVSQMTGSLDAINDIEYIIKLVILRTKVLCDGVLH